MRGFSIGRRAGQRDAKGRARIPAFMALLALVVGAGMQPAAAAPLTWEDSDLDGLYQRVIVQPGGELFAAPGGMARRTLTTFSIYYVFERRTTNGKSWLRIGPGIESAPIGWLPEDSSVDFRQNIVLTFNARQSDSPVLFFDGPESIQDLVAQRETTDFAALAARARSGEDLVESRGIIATQPETVPDFRESFYLLPILETMEVAFDGVSYPRGQEASRLLKIASVTEADESAGETAEARRQAEEDFRTGVLFVIDTTLSMNPYIRRTQALARNLFEKIERSEIGERLSFGVMGYRDSLQARPELEYLTRVYHPLETDFRRKDFLAALDSVTATTVSSEGHEEDGLAAVAEAMDMEAWQDFGARFIILITDAPVRTASDPLASRGLNPGDLASEGRKNEGRFGILSFFMETPPRPDLHDAALRQLGALSRHSDAAPPLLFPVPEGDVEVFGDKAEQAVGRMIELTRERMAENDEENPAPADEPANEEEDGNDPLSGLDDLVDGMRLAWLGRYMQTPAPQLVETWTPGFALDDIRANRPPFSIRVLMTRNQLNRLYQSLGAIEESMRRLTGEESSDSFIDTLRQVLVASQNNPDLIGSIEGGGDAIALDESADSLDDLVDGFIRHLPYKSELLSESVENLENISNSKLQEYLNEVRSKREIYRRYALNESLWVALNDDAGPEEMVYAVPLDQLP